MDFDVLFKILSLGAVGVAGLALFFWREAYAKLLDYKPQGATDDAVDVLKVLADQLGKYQVLVLMALLFSAAAQLATPVVEQYVKKVAARHAILFSITPGDVMDGTLDPAVTFNGQDLTPDQPKGRKFSFLVERPSNVEVSVLQMRDRLNRLTAQLKVQLPVLAAGNAQNAVPPAPGGPEPGP